MVQHNQICNTTINQYNICGKFEGGYVIKDLHDLPECVNFDRMGDGIGVREFYKQGHNSEKIDVCIENSEFYEDGSGVFVYPHAL